jgi:hypothetical protein
VLLGNLVIDAAVILLALRFAGWELERPQLVVLVLKTWGLGFLADIIGALVLIGLMATGWIEAWLDPMYLFSIWDSAAAVLTYLAVIALAGVIIYWGNKRFAVAAGAPPEVAYKVALAMGIVTAPWTFLVPTALFKGWLY